MVRSLLVPLDGSKFAEQALRLAVDIACRAQAELQIAHVHQTTPAVEGMVVDDLEPSLKAQERAYLDDIAARIRTVAPVEVRPVLLEGDAALALQDQVTRSGVDLIVLSTHGRGAFRRFWLGSVADELVRHLSVPLLLIRPGEGPINLTQEALPRHILVPLDGTPLAEQILEPALKLGALVGATYTLVRVVKPALVFDYAPDGSTVEGTMQTVLTKIEEQQRQIVQEARTYLEGVARRLAERGYQAQIRVVTEEQPAIGIMRQAVVDKADLIALATHGRRGLARLILGSVADKIVRGGSQPVLLERPK